MKEGEFFPADMMVLSTNMKKKGFKFKNFNL